MSEEMEKAAIETAYYAITEFQQESQMAGHIKREFDKMFGCHLSPLAHARLGPSSARGRRACARPDCPTRAVGSVSPARRMGCIGTALLTVRRVAQAHMALHTRQELRLARGPRHQKLHLLLHWPDRHPTLQVRVSRRRRGAQPAA